ncbi:hypothetical protein K449DRAFT_437396 [Hypoxylon sp. EC38]|nr:hypothetical protein K449DRAFT_437396 [Hypoxylon sp. EC38]
MSTTQSRAPQKEEARIPSTGSTSSQRDTAQASSALWNFPPTQNAGTRKQGTRALSDISEEPEGWDVATAQAGQGVQPDVQSANTLSAPSNAVNTQAVQGNVMNVNGFYYASLHDLTMTFRRTEQLEHSKWLSQQGIGTLYKIDHCDIYRVVPDGFQLELVAMYRERYGGIMGWWTPDREIFCLPDQGVIDVADDLNARKDALAIPHL